jgi:hypothetical protein
MAHLNLETLVSIYSKTPRAPGLGLVTYVNFFLYSLLVITGQLTLGCVALYIPHLFLLLTSEPRLQLDELHSSFCVGYLVIGSSHCHLVWVRVMAI